MSFIEYTWQYFLYFIEDLPGVVLSSCLFVVMDINSLSSIIDDIVNPSALINADDDASAGKSETTKNYHILSR